MTPIITFATILLALVVAGLALGLLALGLGLVLRLFGIVLKLVFGVIAIVIGAAFDLIAATLALIPMCFHAGVALALVVFGQWTRAEHRAARVNDRIAGIGRRVSEAFWQRPHRMVVGAFARPEVQVKVVAAPPPPPFVHPPRPASFGTPVEVAPQEERTVGMLAHLLAFAGLAFPLGNLVGPLVVWLVRKDRMPYVDEQGRESLNFNATMTLATLFGIVTTPMLVGLLILPVVFLTWFVMTVVAAISAHSGTRFRYPLSIRFLGPAPATPGPAVDAETRRRAAPPPPSRTGAFPGYKVVGTLPAGGSGARLLVATPAADIRRRLPDGVDRVVIKTFALSEGSTLPQIVRESRSMEAATRLGLVLEHHLEGNRFWYAMPYFPGNHYSDAVRSLHRMGEEGGLDEASLRRVLEWTAGLAGTLERYHEAGLWHKDVKPENVLVHGGEARLVDIGLVTSLASGMTLTTHGTEYFRDPEMVRLALRGVKVHEVDGAKFDVYGVGAMLYLGVEDTFPAHGGLSGYAKRSPECVRWVARRAMADYAKRYESAAALRRDLEFIIAAADPFAVKPAMLPSFRGESEHGDSRVESVHVAATPVPDLPGGSWSERNGGAANDVSDEVDDSMHSGRTPERFAAGSPRPRRSPWGLTSPGGRRGAGRGLAALVLFAVGLVAAFVVASVLSSGEASPARVVVIGPEGDLSGISERSSLFATLADRLRRDHGMAEVRLISADDELEARVRGVAANRSPRSRLRGQDIEAALVIDPETNVASLLTRAFGRSSWSPFDLLAHDSWEIRQVPIADVVPVPTGRRVLLLRDPTATVEISSEEIDLWRTLGVDMVEPDAEDAAELAVMLASERTGPEVQARVEAALAEYEASEFRRFREAPAIAPKPISTAIIESGGGRQAIVEVQPLGSRDRAWSADRRLDRRAFAADGVSIN